MAKASVIKKPINNISGELKKNAWLIIFESILTIILGILLIVWPDVVVKVIAYIVGSFLIIKGVYEVINYFIVRGHEDFFNNGLLNGIVAILLGITLFLIGEDVANVFRLVIGIWIIYESLVGINMAIKMHAVKISAWKYILILALIALVVGVFVTFNQGAVIALVGWMIVLSGFISIVSGIIFIQYINKITDALTSKIKDE